MMKCRPAGAAVVVLCAVFAATPVFAQDEPEPQTRGELLRQQREEKAQALVPYEVSAREARLRGLEKAKFPQNWLVKGWNGIRPVFGGMPSGSGTVLGAGYVHGLENQFYQAQVNGRYSTEGFTQFDGEFVIPPPQEGRRYEAKVSAAYQDFTALDFYGLGNSSRLVDESGFFYNAHRVQGDLWLNPRGLLSMGVSAGYLSVRTGAVEPATDPSLERTFGVGQIPGSVDLRTDHVMMGGWLEVDLRDKWHDPPVGVVARVTGKRYEDTTTDRFDFTRVVADVRGYVPLFARNRTLALRFYTSHSIDDEEAQVPFYAMETLGGARTVRGYEEYRFSDTRNLYVSAEYRWEVWAYADIAVFFDAGKVFDDLDEFNFRDMHTGRGAGLRIHAPGGTAFRIDFANSAEGFQLHVSGGPTF